MAYSAEIHCPTIEQNPNITNIKRWDKQQFGRVVWLRVVIPKAYGGL